MCQLSSVFGWQFFFENTLTWLFNRNPQTLKFALSLLSYSGTVQNQWRGGVRPGHQDSNYPFAVVNLLHPSAVKPSRQNIKVYDLCWLCIPIFPPLPWATSQWTTVIAAAHYFKTKPCSCWDELAWWMAWHIPNMAKVAIFEPFQHICCSRAKSYDYLLSWTTNGSGFWLRLMGENNNKKKSCRLYGRGHHHHPVEPVAAGER